MSVYRGLDRRRSGSARIPTLRSAPRLTLEQRTLLGELTGVLEQIRAGELHIVRLSITRIGPTERIARPHTCRLDVELEDGPAPEACSNQGARAGRD